MITFLLINEVKFTLLLFCELNVLRIHKIIINALDRFVVNDLKNDVFKTNLLE